MATDKRDRQRANREEKKAAEAKTAKRQHRFDLVKKWAIYAIIFIVVILALRSFVG
jgi:cell division protein FtsL